MRRSRGRLAGERTLPGADVAATREVQVRVGEGVEEDVVRTVSENAIALKFDHASFEKDYITGRYGAIPFIGGLHRLIGGADG